MAAPRPVRSRLKTSTKKALLAAILLVAAGCSLNSAKKHFVLAENLWNDGKYAAAVNEFEKAAAKDPNGKLGQQALYRAASTQALFLSQYASAIRKFKEFADATKDRDLAWDAEKQMGELYFNKLEQYEQAVHHYLAMVREKPSSPEAPEFLYRVGRSQFFLGQFDLAIATFKELSAKHPQTPWGEKAAYETGAAYFTRGAQSSNARSLGAEAYPDAIAAYQAFITRYPQSALVAEAKFGIASCLEEMDQHDAAYQAFSELKTTYPSRNVILIKLARIRERKSHRSN